MIGFVKKILFVKEVSTLKEIRKEDKGKYDLILIKTEKPEMLRRIVDKASAYFSSIFVLGMNDEINRVALEHKKVKALVSPEYHRAKDFLHYRNSGLNQVLCKIARDNDKMIIENLNDLRLERKEVSRALILGRMIQNARLCKKYYVPFIVGDFVESEKELVSSYDLRTFEKLLI